MVPQKLQERLLDLHHDHGEVVKMKSLPRNVMWWPGMEANIEALDKAGTPAIKAVKSAPSQALLHPWRWPNFLGSESTWTLLVPYRGKLFMLLVDTHSKWPEILEMTSITADMTPLQPSDVCCPHFAYQNNW